MLRLNTPAACQPSSPTGGPSRQAFEGSGKSQRANSLSVSRATMGNVSDRRFSLGGFGSSVPTTDSQADRVRAQQDALAEWKEAVTELITIEKEIQEKIRGLNKECMHFTQLLKIVVEGRKQEAVDLNLKQPREEAGANLQRQA